MIFDVLMDNLTCVIAWGAVLVFIGMILNFKSSATPPRTQRGTEQGYIIQPKQSNERVRTHGEMVVSRRVFHRAMRTGEYDYIGKATYQDAGNHYYNNQWIPGGHIRVEPAHYVDERLSDK